MAHSHQVVSNNYPFLAVRLQVRRRQHEADALVDTGFTGDLVLPTSFADASLAVPDAQADWQLAHGGVIRAPVYLGTLEIIGLSSVPAMITLLGNECLLGRGVIDRFRVTFDHGRGIIVEP
jgi:predicted aspartyl protease